MSHRNRRIEMSPEGRFRVGDYNERQLHEFLVEDAVRHHATDLRWAILAYRRIGKLNGRGPEEAFKAVVDEVEALTGMAMMPVASLSEVELRKLAQQ